MLMSIFWKIIWKDTPFCSGNSCTAHPYERGLPRPALKKTAAATGDFFPAIVQLSGTSADALLFGTQSVLPRNNVVFIFRLAISFHHAQGIFPAAWGEERISFFFQHTILMDYRGKEKLKFLLKWGINNIILTQVFSVMIRYLYILLNDNYSKSS